MENDIGTDGVTNTAMIDVTTAPPVKESNNYNEKRKPVAPIREGCQINKKQNTCEVHKNNKVKVLVVTSKKWGYNKTKMKYEYKNVKTKKYVCNGMMSGMHPKGSDQITEVEGRFGEPSEVKGESNYGLRTFSGESRNSDWFESESEGFERITRENRLSDEGEVNYESGRPTI